MTPEQIERVKISWRKTAHAQGALTDSFYTRLFALDPALRTMFTGDLTVLKEKIYATLTVVVDHLDEPVKLLPKIRALGERHSGYGVRDEHYALVEKALLGALADCLGDAYDQHTEAAWVEAYRTLADAMIAADVDSTLYPA